MSEFLTSLDGRWITDKKFMLLAPLIYESGILRRTPGLSDALADGILRIPAGFVTDFASVPRVPVIYTLFGDRAHHESVPHDFLYQTHLTAKPVADKLFREAMVARGKPKFVVEGMYWGVVLGGQSSYNSGPSRYKVLNPKGASR